MDVKLHVINALPPVADVWGATADTDIIDAGAGDGVLFIVQWTAAAKTGFSMVHTAGVSNAMWQIYVDSAEIAEEGYRYVRMSTDETANHAVLGGVLALVINPRYAPQVESALD